jgi:hypothetical protein
MTSEIRDRLAQELADSDPPPLGTLVADAAAAGARRRRHCYAAVASGAAALVALTSVGLGAALRPVAPPSPGLQIGADQTTAPVDGHRPSDEIPSPEPPVSVPPGHKPAFGQALVALLTELAPNGTITEVDFTSTPPASSGRFVLDDGHGKATISVEVSTAPADHGPGSIVTFSTTPEGYAVQTVTIGPFDSDCTDAKCGLKQLRVQVHRPDGIYIVVDAYNGPFGHNRAATREDTILDATELLNIAKDPRWGMTMPADFVEHAVATVHRS